MSKKSRLLNLVAALAVTAALPACAQNAATGGSSFNLLSSEQEKSLGQQEHPKVLETFGGAYDDPNIGAYTAGLGQRLVENSELAGQSFTFTVLNSDIINAMALPGGYVYVTRGLLALANNEAELAGVLAHEIGHVTGQHTAERYSRSVVANVGVGLLGVLMGSPELGQIAGLGAQAYLQGFSRGQESEADTLGIRYMSKAGYSPEAMASFLADLRRQSALEAELAGRSPDDVDQFNIMQTHPRTVDRVRDAMAEAAKTASPGTTLNRDSYLARLDGLIYGDDPEKGVVRGREFLHPGLNFRFSVPTGFRVVNTDEAVLAQHPSGAIIVFDTAKTRTTDPAAYLQNEVGRKARLASLERIEVNGYPAATATMQGRTKEGPVDLRQVVILKDGRLWRFAFATPPRMTGALSEELRRTTYSFRGLSAEEKAGIKPYRLRIIAVKAGDTVESLAARMPVEDMKEARFRALNGLEPGQPLPPPGTKVKTIGY